MVDYTEWDGIITRRSVGVGELIEEVGVRRELDDTVTVGRVQPGDDAPVFLTGEEARPYIEEAEREGLLPAAATKSIAHREGYERMPCGCPIDSGCSGHHGAGRR